jgi:hypothetical protein
MVKDVPHDTGFLQPRRSEAPRLDICIFYLLLSSPATAPAELSLIYLPAIGAIGTSRHYTSCSRSCNLASWKRPSEMVGSKGIFLGDESGRC